MKDAKKDPPHEHRIDLHLHDDSGSSDLKKLVVELLERVTSLKLQGDRLMAKAEDLNAKLDRINVATDNIAADIRALKDQIGTGMSQADVDAVNTRLESTAVALEAIAAETPDVPPVA